ncbi:MAG: RsmB/NOP family class I SAM-dependent RNA methyltransferase, partial [Calditrichaeota bacterium]
MSVTLHVFDRYRPIIDDWPAFVEASTTPLPTCIWINTLRGGVEDVTALLGRSGIAYEPVGWSPTAFRLPHDVQIGNHLAFLAGLCHVQEEVALPPVLLLDPKPGERVLDLCASPGNKTAQIAVSMRNTGTIVANDFNVSRMRPLKRVVSRLGLVDVTTTFCDAASYPTPQQPFDRVLVDVPCSCEGTCRKNPEVLEGTKPHPFAKLSRVQTAILRRALQLCKVGGRVVYSTCTYAPEENEMVVQAALDSLEPGIRAEILPAEVPGLVTSPGLNKWQGRSFRKDMVHAIRIYPHQNDTGGFFIAVLEKVADARRPHRIARKNGDTPHNTRVREGETSRWMAWLEARFGVPPTELAAYKVVETNAKTLSLLTSEHTVP